MSLDAQFEESQVKLKTLPAQSNDVLLKLYSLYKQATNGDADGKRPGMFDIVKKAKYDAWESLKGMSQDQAKKEYVKFVDSLLAQAK